jgi:hypothetical protein
LLTGTDSWGVAAVSIGGVADRVTAERAAIEAAAARACSWKARARAATGDHGGVGMAREDLASGLRDRRAASLRELMERMGHTSTRAALNYQHATRQRDEAIAAAMGEVLASVRRKGPARSR